MAAKDDQGQGGIVYLLCFAHSPYKHARHYLGATGLTLEERIGAHRGENDKGRPAKLISALLAAGGDFVVADVWETTTRSEAFELERRLKLQCNRVRLCSICTPGNRAGSRIMARRKAREEGPGGAYPPAIRQ